MLPENQFLSAVPQKEFTSDVSLPRNKERSKFYSTQQVLELTLMSRFTLIRKVNDGLFPSPVNPGSTGANFYVKTEVDEWIKENVEWIKKREHKTYSECYVRFDSQEMKEIKTAIAALDCTLEKFISDAAIWKAKRIMDQLNIEHNTEYCS